MDLFIVYLLVCSLLTYHDGVRGANWNLSSEEEFKIERQLKLLTKPVIKTVKTDDGDLYDCVDFFKQPAFDHPLLKNYNRSNYEVLPPSVLNTIKKQSLKKITEVDNIGFKVLECPIGTVPIRRVTREDLINDYVASKSIGSQNHQVHFAGLWTTGDKYKGAEAFISVHKPGIVGGQYSASRLKIKNGPDVIQAGWRVDQTLYHDTNTRFFIHTDAGQTHCFNTRCPGFVHVRHDIPLDSIFKKYTIPGGNEQFVIRVFIVRDTGGNWNLILGPQLGVLIGYWPHSLFTGLSNLASFMEWGGEVYSPPGTPSPSMGSGEGKMRYDLRYDAFYSHVSLLTEDGRRTDAKDVEEAADTYDYSIEDQGVVEPHGHLFFYGGSSRA